jgi:hypothetical protein
MSIRKVFTIMVYELLLLNLYIWNYYMIQQVLHFITYVVQEIYERHVGIGFSRW